MQINAAWQQLSSRDKLLAVFGTSLLVLFLFYSFVWEPLSSKINGLRQDIADNRDLLAWMQVQVPHIKTLKATHKDTSTKAPLQGSLLSQVDNSLKQPDQTIMPTDISQVDTKTVHLTFKSVAFNEVMRWYEGFSQQNPIIATTVSIKALEDPGLVQADFTLSTE
jgi:type II secretory pathway component PulM